MGFFFDGLSLTPPFLKTIITFVFTSSPFLWQAIVDKSIRDNTLRDGNHMMKYEMEIEFI